MALSNVRGSLILLNGASSAGKTTLCKHIRNIVPAPFLHFSLDFIMFDADVLPRKRNVPELGITWKQMRPNVFEGFYRCLPALLSAGNNLLVDVIIEDENQRNRLLSLLATYDVFFVGVHCSLETLIQREMLRGDRRTGDAELDLKTVHAFLSYDLEINSEAPAEVNASKVVEAWLIRERPSVFERSRI